MHRLDSARTCALTLLLVAFWAVTHRYKGLGGDAELYAVQAFSRIHPNLAQDLYLRNTSQDSYTLFSAFYARCIGLWGLRNAALALTIAFKVWFFGAAWALARQLTTGYAAFLATALLIVMLGEYGAYHVFRYAEDWLTARSLAEALVITALACYFRGWRAIGLLIACAAMFVHPLMTLPGLLLLVFMELPLRLTVAAAAAGILATLGVAMSAARQPAIEQMLMVMDANWLEVVRERSQFLFLQLWRAADWKLNARPFISLTITALAIPDRRVHKLCIAALLVGGVGLAVALIASLIPIPVLLQGQAWRSMWVTSFTSVLLLAPTVLALWRNEKCGFACATLMIAGGTLPADAGIACLACAWVLWQVRDRITARAAMVLRLSSLAIGAMILGWAVKASWSVAGSRPLGSDEAPWTLVRSLPGLELFSLLIVGTLAWWLRANRSMVVLSVASAVLVAASICVLPRTFRDRSTEGTAAEVEEFRDWRRAIPTGANVFVVPAHNSATFAWFTLERPSYLTVDQSSGVVFSRATALEVLRRSNVLMPLMDPDWRLLTQMKRAHSGSGISAARPLTRDRLIHLCSDPQLNFIVAKERVGFDPLRHTHPGTWQDWNLYDCRRVPTLTTSRE